jgi:hypothetical protein
MEAPSSKTQAPSKFQENGKSFKRREPAPMLLWELLLWDLSFGACLGFGAWNFVRVGLKSSKDSSSPHKRLDFSCAGSLRY